MRYFSTFTGFGAFEQAVKNTGLGWECVGYSEIDPYAVKVFEQNHPGAKNYGNIQGIKELPDFDLLVGGFPCQDLSIAKKNREGLKGSRSSLFYELIRLIELKKPKYILIENVFSASKQDRDIVTQELSRAMGQRIEPVCINSAKLTAQQRKRLFWCNWKVEQPEDRGIYLRDILESGYTEREKSLCITKNYREDPLDRYLYKSTKQLVFERPHRIGNINGTNAQGNRIYGIHGKSVCVSLPGWSKEQLKQAVDNNLLAVRKLIPTEVEQLQGFPRGYSDCVSMTRRYMGLGNAFCVPVIEHIIKSLVK